MNDSRPIVVLKIGGSLLDLPDLSSRITTLLAGARENRPLLIAGGGPAADVVRGWHETFSLSEEASHWLAIESLSLTANLLAKLIPRSRLVFTQLEAETCWQRGEYPVLNVAAWVKTTEAAGFAIPHCWDVTSDSLAAWVAASWSAELWFLKSVDLPGCLSAKEASIQGLVDRYFPRIVHQIKQVRWCNLRNDEARLRIEPGFMIKGGTEEAGPLGFS